jgi:molybdenum cofactor biosynthesis protein B
MYKAVSHPAPTAVSDVPFLPGRLPVRPHPDSSHRPIACAVITVSDTRTPESDRSGQMIQQLLQEAQHPLVHYALIPDEPQHIHQQVIDLCQRPDLNTIILNGGTGIAPRDTTYDAIERLLEKTLPGFGELFRALSYQDIGSRAMASRAIAGVYNNTLIFSLPGSTNAVVLAMQKLILPELAHLTYQINA